MCSNNLPRSLLHPLNSLPIYLPQDHHPSAASSSQTFYGNERTHQWLLVGLRPRGNLPLRPISGCLIFNTLFSLGSMPPFNPQKGTNESFSKVLKVPWRVQVIIRERFSQLDRLRNNIGHGCSKGVNGSSVVGNNVAGNVSVHDG